MIKKKPGLLALGVAFVFLVAACAASDPTGGEIVSEPVSASPSPTLSAPAPTKPPGATRIEEGPGRFGSPPGYRFDAIPPIYDPQFASAGEVPLEEEELVMGVEIEGEAKAYRISVLRSREMVNDELAGIPILVTW